MPAQTIRVPHLGGIDAGYQVPYPCDSKKPTIVLVNSFMTSSELYRSQFENKDLTDVVNLLAIELLGHGATRTQSEHWTYWDTAIMNLQVMEALGVKEAFVLGTSQGGWITARMALLAPEKIKGIIPLGSSMDYESARSIALGCWDGHAMVTPNAVEWTSALPTPDFQPSLQYTTFLIAAGFGPAAPNPQRDFWIQTVQSNYSGDDGRRRARMSAINLAERDGLHGRLPDITCPVLWMQGTDDQVYSVANAKEEIRLFTGVRDEDRKLVVVEGGMHFLSASHPAEVDREVRAFVLKYA